MESKDRDFRGRIGRTEISVEGAKVSKWNDVLDGTRVMVNPWNGCGKLCLASGGTIRITIFLCSVFKENIKKYVLKGH